MKSKIVSPQEAVALVHDGDTLICSGFGVVGVPDELLVALEKRFLNSAAPRDLTVFFGGGPGDGKDQGLNRLAECDARGNINVSRFGPKLAGAGGFINITQNSRTVVFVGTFTAGGLKIAISDGKLNILSEGKHRKFRARPGASHLRNPRRSRSRSLNQRSCLERPGQITEPPAWIPWPDSTPQGNTIA